MAIRWQITTVCLAWWTGACHWAIADTPSEPHVGPAVASPEDPSVRTALRQELEGNNVERHALLQHILAQAPDHPEAHWHIGDIKIDGKWMPYGRVVDDAEDRWHKLYLYRKARGERGDTVDDHLFLADGAHERSMWDEERAHLTRIVELDWDNAEARRRLGDFEVDGFWVAREEVLEFVRELARTSNNRIAWDPQIQRLVRRILKSRNAAWEKNWQELAAIRDPAAIPSIEAALAEGDERAAISYLNWLDDVDAWEAAAAMARQAVLAPSAAIRSAAQTRLKSRGVHDYAPILLSVLRANPEISSRLFITRLGGLMYFQHVQIETQHDIRVRNLAVLYGPEVSFNSMALEMHDIRIPGLGSLADFPELQAMALRHLRQHYQAFSLQEGRDITSGLETQNGRITRSLSVATGRDELKTPHDCWQWWLNEQQVYSAGQKPLLQRDYEETWTVDRRRGGIQQTPQRFVQRIQYSCFAAGTPVVTEYGPKPIEDIQLGDRVLAQDVESGELAFKPVFQTTVRPPVALMKLTTDRGDLICTGGHPFWINGHSWLYARELQPGMRFHSVDGASEILSVEDAGREDKAYNLIVADFHTYFAGDGRILSHDNTPRAPTNALVPGLMPDYASADPVP